MTGLQRSVVKGVRKLVGADLILNTFAHQLSEINRRIDALTQPPVASAPVAPPAPVGARVVEVQLNADPLMLPEDVLKFVMHTAVSAPDDPIPKLLAETEHYLWTRSRLSVGDSAMDIGSNIGLFAVMMAKRVKYGQVGTIHAFEPSPAVFSDLTNVIAANKLDNVVLNQKAVSDARGVARFRDIQADSVCREASQLDGAGGAAGGEAANLIEVETISVDEYVAYHNFAPRLLKIDVEGAEFLVLEGARKFIRAEHPFLVIEIHPDATGVFDHARLRSYLDEYGYRYHSRGKIYYCE